ncbi:uncharacterized protein LOC112045778 [Bicyclus anynana]|uniref:Uncharacterized protein LOC112045778 n=1 Tax=Bicyclus anynana TaxID=110368 RepID=A0A6J1MYG3_BICAN|nr:uncharacterized protein LOC112045778 [Bicyclus anynana]
MLMVLFNLFLCNHFVTANQSFNYEKINRYGLGKPIIFKSNFGYAYPEELRTKKPALYVRSPYRSVYQGARHKGDDKRVYNKNFLYPPKPSGHHLYCQGVFECKLSHMAVETNGSIPIIFRGGVGYKHFTVIIRAEPFKELTGRVRAYCRQTEASKDGDTFRKIRKYL